MKRSVAFICIALIANVVPCTLSAQLYYQAKRGFKEIGIQTGISGYLGDLGGTLGAGSTQYKTLDMRLPNIMFSVNATYEAATWLKVRPNATVTQIVGDDKSLSNSATDKSRFYRNLSFKSMVYEASMLAEINALYFLPSYAEQEHKLFPYAAVGLGVFHFNPKGSVDGKWYNLREFSLEGQGMQEYQDRKIYSKVQLCLPVGFGFKYYLTPGFYTGLEFLYRKTFTDYLDDVSTTYIEPELFDKYFNEEKAATARKLAHRSLSTSQYRAGQQRGAPKEKDAYFTFGVRFGLNFSAIE
jgi:hypothetical protein